MDIRSYFFRNSAKAENSLKKSLMTPENKKEDKNHADAKIKTCKRKISPKNTDDVVISDSDLEDPVPSKLRKAAEKKTSPKKNVAENAPQKFSKNSTKPERKNRIIYSDSDDSPVKQPPKFTKIADKKPPRTPEKPVRAKIQNGKVRRDDDDILIEDDDEDFAEEAGSKTKKAKFSPKKLKKQPKLTMKNEDFKSKEPQKPSKSEQKIRNDSKKTAVKPKPAPVPHLNPISVAEFFNGAKTKGKKSSPVLVRQREDHGDGDFNEALDRAAVDLLSPSSTIASTLSEKEIPKSVVPKKSEKSPKKIKEKEEVVISPAKAVTPKNVTPKKNECVSKKKARVSAPSISATSISSLSDGFCPLVDRYRPKSVKQIIGQQGERSCVNKLLKWLKNWNRWHLTKTEPKKKGFGANDDGSIFKCVLLSGPPGIGKTTSAKLCCEELGIKYIEFNASDTRNKKTLENGVMEAIGSRSVNEYFAGIPSHKSEDSPTHALIMDEVDGMSGNEDRAGISELISLIKRTKIPIICICNDRHAQKIRSLSNYCYDLRFHRPQVSQIKGAMMSVAFKEKLKISPKYLEQMIEASNHDIRQVLYQLSLLSPDKNYDDNFSMAKKDLTTNIFEVSRVILSDNEEKRAMNLNQKFELFFSDYNAVPLFVHENYLNIEIKNVKKMSEKLAAVASAASSIAFGDFIERRIRSSGDWSLLNDQAIFSSVIPSETLKGYLKGAVQFPQWFGKNSKQTKARRLLQELYRHTSLKTSCNTTSFAMDYLPVLRDRLLQPLLADSTAAEGTEKVLSTLCSYDLTKEDMDNILELSQFPNSCDSMSKVPAKVKSALTRAYNKRRPVLPYSTGPVVSGGGKRKKGAPVLETPEDAKSPEEEDEAEEVDIDIE